jgi:hypothetical protein
MPYIKLHNCYITYGANTSKRGNEQVSGSSPLVGSPELA